MHLKLGTDSTIEMEFARKLEQGEVTIYAKLPNGFKIFHYQNNK